MINPKVGDYIKFIVSAKVYQVARVSRVEMDGVVKVNYVTPSGPQSGMLVLMADDRMATPTEAIELALRYGL